MGTLPEDCEAIAKHLHEVVRRHGLKMIKLSIYGDANHNGKDQFSFEIEHSTGKIELEESRGYFNLPIDLGNIGPVVAAGVAAKVFSFEKELAKQKKEQERALRQMEFTREYIKQTKMLAPLPLDQIVYALEDSDKADEACESDGVEIKF